MLWFVPLILWLAVLTVAAWRLHRHPPETNAYNDPFVDFYGKNVLITLLLAAAVCFGGAITGSNLAHQPVLQGSVPLVALRDKEGGAGSFFLGSGTLASESYFFYYARRGDGGFSAHKMLIDANVVLYEEDRTDAELEIFSEQFVSPHGWWFGFPEHYRTYHFRVPKGTIRSGYTA